MRFAHNGSVVGIICFAGLVGCDTRTNSNQQQSEFKIVNQPQHDLVQTSSSQAQERSRIIGGVPVHDRDYQLSAEQYSEQPVSHDVAVSSPQLENE